jgi:hypothetical protein
MEKHWKQREKQIERVVKNTAGLVARLFHELEAFICKEAHHNFKNQLRHPTERDI